MLISLLSWFRSINTRIDTATGLPAYISLPALAAYMYLVAVVSLVY